MHVRRYHARFPTIRLSPVNIVSMFNNDDSPLILRPSPPTIPHISAAVQNAHTGTTAGRHRTGLAVEHYHKVPPVAEHCRTLKGLRRTGWMIAAVGSGTAAARSCEVAERRCTGVLGILLDCRSGGHCLSWGASCYDGSFVAC